TSSAATTKAIMGEGSGTLGGYLVPTDYAARLMEVLAEEDFIYPRATVIPMGSSMLLAPTVDAVTTPAAIGTSPFFGGLKFLWGRGQAPTETEPKFRCTELRSWDLLGYCTVSNQFLGDIGPEGEAYLIKLFGRAASWSAQYAFMQGTGSAQQMPLGMLNSPA